MAKKKDSLRFLFVVRNCARYGKHIYEYHFLIKESAGTVPEMVSGTGHIRQVLKTHIRVESCRIFSDSFSRRFGADMAGK
jgi:hypothetical protein